MRDDLSSLGIKVLRSFHRVGFRHSWTFDREITVVTARGWLGSILSV